MNIIFQYYNEIVLAFGDYEVDYRDGVIVIEVPASNKPFDLVCSKVEEHLERIATTLEPRDRNIVVLVERGSVSKEIILATEASS